MEPEAFNWLSVIAGTIAAFLLGWAIYSPKLFGKGWAEGSGVELGAASSMPVGAMVMQLVALFGLACLISRTAMTHDLYTAIIGILTAAAFVVSGGKFSGKNTYAITVDGGYIIAAGALMIVIRGIAGAM